MTTPEPDKEVTEGRTSPESEGIRSQAQEKTKLGNGGDPQSKKKRVPVVFTREAGKSILPFSRVQKIIRADKDIPVIAKDATFLISLATEEFIKRLCEAGKRVAEREKRSTVQHKDIATVVRKIDEFLFLEEIIPWMSSDPPARRKLQGTTGINSLGAPTLLDQFVISSKRSEEESTTEQTDVVMNEDGTMVIAGSGEEEFGSG